VTGTPLNQTRLVPSAGYSAESYRSSSAEHGLTVQLSQQRQLARVETTSAGDESDDIQLGHDDFQHVHCLIDRLLTDPSHDRQRRAEEFIKTESGYLSVDCSLPERLGRRCQPARVGTGDSSPERLSRPRQQARKETDSAGGEFQCARCLIGQPPTDPSHDLVAETGSSTTCARCLIGQSPADLSHDLEAATETSVTRVRCLGDQPPTDLSHNRRCQAEEFISLSRPLVGQIF